jgi:PAS domain S-box-containing protein
VVTEPSNFQPERLSDSANAKRALEQAPQTVAEVLESISDAFVALDKQWRFTYLNRAAERLVLRTREDLLGKSVWEEFPEAVGSTFEREYRRAAAQGIMVEFEEYFPPLTAWFSVRAYPSASGLAIYFQNVNERRQRDEELHRATDRFGLAVAAVDGLVYDVDIATGTVVRSDGLFRLFGYDPEAAEGTVAWWEERIHPDDRTVCFASARQALADPSQAQYEVEYRLRHRDGHDVLVSDRALILRDEDGQAVRLVGTMCDITQRRRMEEALRASEERHRIISELTSDYNYTLRVDPDGSSTLELVTEGFTKITGYTLEQINARGGWPALIHPGDMHKATQGHQRVLSGKVNESIIRILSHEGSTRWVRNLNKPVWGAKENRVIRIVGAGQDVTERVEAEEQLRDSRQQLQALSRQLIAAQENERRRLARELHDELGQTLTAISVNLQAARVARGESSRTHLGEAITIVDRAIEQVRHLSLDLRPSMLDDLGLEAALRWYADRLLRRTGLAVHLDTNLGRTRLPAEMETVCFRVAQEALTNAARHACARRVWIELQHRASVVELLIRDDGSGFDPKTARKRAAEGANFGLLGMQERVELLGGQFTLESRPAQGTSIHARFVLLPTPRLQVPSQSTTNETDQGVARR